MHANLSQSRDFSLLEETIGYKFKDKELLRLALTHSSFSNEMKVKNKVFACNERLEFLGDSILSLITSEYLYLNLDTAEGELTKIRSEAVCEDALALYAAEINLGDYLLLGKGEEQNNGRKRKSINADAFEALIAAIYLDCRAAGDRSELETVKSFVLPRVSRAAQKTIEAGATDYKTRLQQIVQSIAGEILEYVTVGESGPDHDKTFYVDAMLNSNVIGKGRGRTKREAEQQAAKEALVLFGEK